MAIAIDTNSKAGLWNNAQSSVTWSHTCNGSDRVLVVGVDSYANKTTGVTYNGTAMGYVDKRYFTSISQRYCSVYVLANPSSGANNVVWSLSGNDYCECQAVSLTGAKQTSQPQTYAGGNTANQASVTQSVTTTGVCWLIWFVDWNGSGTAGTGTTLIDSTANGSKLFKSTAAVSAGSNSLAATSVSTSYTMPMILVAIEQVAAAGPTNVKTYNTNAIANIKTINTNAIANVKSLNTNT